MSVPASEDAVRTVGRAGNPPVLLLHPWWGITPAVQGWAGNLANVGRCVLLPDLYAGKTATTIDEAEALSQAALDDDATFCLIGHARMSLPPVGGCGPCADTGTTPAAESGYGTYLA